MNIDLIPQTEASICDRKLNIYDGDFVKNANQHTTLAKKKITLHVPFLIFVHFLVVLCKCAT